MKATHVNRRVGRGLVGAAIAAHLCWATAVLAQTAGGASPPAVEPAGERVSQAEAIEQTIKRCLELVQQLEDATQVDKAWTDAYREAAKRSNEVLDADPLNVRARYVQGRLAILSGKPRDALPLIEAYARSKEGANDWMAHKLLGDLYLVSYAEQARASYKQASTIAQDEAEPFIGLARALIKLNRAEEAIENARTAIRNDRKDTAVYRQVLAEAQLLQPDQQQDAIAAAREAVQITERKIRENPENLSLLGELKGEYALLLRCCDALYKTQKDKPEMSADIVLDVARTMQDQADLERLIAYHSALQLVTNARETPQLHTSANLMLEEARLARLVGRDERAVEVLNELLEAQPDNAAARELLGVIQGASGADLSAAPAAGQ